MRRGWKHSTGSEAAIVAGLSVLLSSLASASPFLAPEGQVRVATGGAKQSVAEPVVGETSSTASPERASATSASPTPTRSAASSPPNDLNPRPLGAARESKPAAAAKPDQPSAASTLWSNPAIRTGGSLLLVLGLIFVLAALAKRFGKHAGLAGALGPGGRAPEGLLEVLGRYPIARGQTLILLKLDSRVLLIAQMTPRVGIRGGGGAGSLTTLCEITQPEEVASILVKAGEHDPKAPAAKFQHLLHAFDRKHAPEPDAAPVEIDLRRVQHGADGDRVETWDDQAAAPAAHAFPTVEPLPAPRRAGAEPASASTDSFGAIRQRLHALRGEAHR